MKFSKIKRTISLVCLTLNKGYEYYGEPMGSGLAFQPFRRKGIKVRADPYVFLEWNGVF